MEINPREFKFNLGDEVKDAVTGLKGIVVSRTQWLNNCNTYAVQPQQLKDGKPIEKTWFDEPQIILVKRAKIGTSERKTGGPERPVIQTNR